MVLLVFEVLRWFVGLHNVCLGGLQSCSDSSHRVVLTKLGGCCNEMTALTGDR